MTTGSIDLWLDNGGSWPRPPVRTTKQNRDRDEKKKRRRLPGAAVMLQTGDLLDDLMLRGKGVKAQVADRVLSAEASVSMDQISEITFGLYDPDFRLLRSGLFDTGGRVIMEGFAQEITAVETGQAADGRGMVTVRARSQAVGFLRRRTGRKVMRNASPSEFVISECRDAGIKYVVQPSAKRKQVARDVRKNGEGGRNANTWTTFERLAREVGFVLFEAGGTVYFGKPSWFLERDTTPARVTWLTGEGSDCIGVPQFIESAEGDPLSVSFQVPRSRLAEFLPGMRVKLRFPIYGERAYLIKSLSFPIAGPGNLSVTAGRPRDPKAEPPQRRNTGGSGGRTDNRGGRARGGGGGPATLGNLLTQAGFRGKALEVAAGVAIAESGGFANGRYFVHAGVLGDTTLVDSKWGPSVGVFQIRSLRNPGAWSGEDRLRVRSKLDNALYNAKVAYRLSNGGKDWSAWSAYTSGRYKQFVGKTGAHVLGWNPPGGGGGGRDGKGKKGGGNHAGGGGSPGGRGTATLFTSIALSQAGDRYIYGAEASLSDPNPSAFDCSELVQWAAARAGGYMPDGSSAQMSYMRSKGTAMSVDAAKRLRGALLWKPGHIEISLGGGKGTIGAVGSSYGVRVMPPGRSFSWAGAGRVPGLRYG